MTNWTTNGDEFLQERVENTWKSKFSGPQLIYRLVTAKSVLEYWKRSKYWESLQDILLHELTRN